MSTFTIETLRTEGSAALEFIPADALAITGTSSNIHTEIVRLIWYYKLEYLLTIINAAVATILNIEVVKLSIASLGLLTVTGESSVNIIEYEIV
jgi:hypothetical protein